MNYEKGQLLVELLVAMGIFAIVSSVVLFLILDTYLADRVGRERMVAAFLTREGMEAARAIRDDNWENLTDGSYGLAISENKWIFQGTEESLEQLREGKRKIIVETLDPDRKKITSRVTWRFSEARTQDIIFITYLTNWQKPLPPYIAQLHFRWRNDDGGE